MQNILPVLCFIGGGALGWLLAWAWHRSQRAVLDERLRNREQQYTQLQQALDEARQKLSDTFKALSAEALRSNNQAFLDLARTALERAQQAGRSDLELRQQAIADLIAPVRESLTGVDRKMQELETARAGAYATLAEQVRSLAETQAQLRTETGKLVTALRAPAVRGRWGEIQLKRVVEMAGMLEHCDFYSQPVATGEEGRFRPDLLVRLPGAKNIVVDAKAPLEAYLAAVDATDDTIRRARQLDHARQVRAHIAALARRAYWDQFEPAPEFIVMFLPGESFFSAALECDPSLIDAGAAQRIILATPTTLIALLRAVAYGWQQERIAQNAEEVSRLGKELYKRVSDMASHWSRVGKSLERAVEAYNSALGSLESRVLVSARKFAEMEAAAFGVLLEPLEPVDTRPRKLQSPEMTAGEGPVNRELEF